MFDILASSEQSCIRDALGDAELESVLSRPVLSEGDTPTNWEVSIFSCLAPETARGVLLSMMLAEIQDDPDFELSDQDASCLKGSFADVDVAALIATSDAYAVMGEELFSNFMRCIPEQFVTFMFGVVVELSEEEASCVRTWAADVDLDAVIANPEDPAVAVDFVAGLIPCVPDLFLVAMLEETGTEMEDLSDDELSCLREWVTNADWTELTVSDGDAAGVEFALEFLACVPRLASADSADTAEVVATALPAPTTAPTVAPVADGTSTPVAGGEVEIYARECQQATASLDVALAMIESEGSGEDLTWGEFAEILSAVSSAYRELQPPPELREYHDAQLRALDGLLDHALSRPGSESFVEEFALAFAELFGLVFEVAFDPEKTDEEKEMLIEEATEGLLSAIFGIAFMDAVTELEEIESQLSEDTVEVLYVFGCGQSVSGDFAGDSAVQPEVPVTDDYADAFESAAPVMVGASVDGALGDDGEVNVFVFDAEEGELYEVDVALGNLSDSVVTLYGPAGEWLASNDDYGDSFASRLIWKAPSSGEYYVEVSGYGDTGTYTLTVSLSDIADDHGGDLESATSITVGESIEGSVDYESDSDFFVFEAEDGELYQIDVVLGTLPDSLAVLYDANEVELAFNDDFGDSLASRIVWQVPASGRYYVEVAGYGDTGTYSLTVDIADIADDRAEFDDEAIASDRAVLVALYNATSGPNWVDNTNWLSDAPVGEWHGVETSDNGSVIRLILYQNGLIGEIPPELRSLSNLTMLVLAGNGLSGTILAELGGLAYLEELYLEENNLSGTIPPELGGLASMTVLSLGNNQLGGEIPSELGSVSSLMTLGLEGNNLSGAIPSELSGLVNLQHLILGKNQLSGEIPNGLANLSNLTVLGLEDNQLSGDIPPALGSLTDLQQLYLGRNQLSGDIPEEMADLSNLVGLGLENNQLSGNIPAWLGDLTNLNTLILQANQLGGGIPPELGNLGRLENLGLRNNQLSGEIPSQLGSLANLAILDLGSNQLTGSVPVELGALHNLAILNLSGNQLNGCVPGSLQAQLDMDESDLGDLQFCSDNEVPTAARPFGDLVVFEDPWGYMQMEVPADWEAQPRSDDTFTFIDLQGGGNVLSITKLDASGVPLDLFASIFESGLVDEHGRENVTAKVGSTPQGDPAARFDVTPDGGLSQKMMYVPVTDSEAFLIVYVFVVGQFDEGKDLASYSFDTFRVKPTTLGASLAPMPMVNRDTVERRVPSHAT